jgi:hypothetical protein
VNTVLIFFNTMPEAGRLALVGLCLIVGALVLRKVLTLFQTVLNPARKADAEAK